MNALRVPLAVSLSESAIRSLKSLRMFFALIVWWGKVARCMSFVRLLVRGGIAAGGAHPPSTIAGGLIAAALLYDLKLLVSLS